MGSGAQTMRLSAGATGLLLAEGLCDSSAAGVEKCEAGEQWSRREQRKQPRQVFSDDLWREACSEALAGVAGGHGIDDAHHSALGQCRRMLRSLVTSSASSQMACAAIRRSNGSRVQVSGRAV